MKKLLQLGVIFCGLLMTQFGYSQDFMPSNNDGAIVADTNAEGCCAPTGEKWELYACQKPCYYNDWKCVEERIPCKKRCCRYVNQEYQVQKCRYVPQYYCETKCRQVPEYYDVDDCKVCKKWVCNRCCTYKTSYQWKHVCGEAAARPASGCCPTGGCPAN